MTRCADAHAEAFQCFALAPHGFDAYCRKAETGGTVERVCVALDVGTRDADAGAVGGGAVGGGSAVVLPALGRITQKSSLSTASGNSVGPRRAARRRGGAIPRADGARYHARDIEQRGAAAAPAR